MNRYNLDDILNTRNEICLSVIVPMVRTGADRQQNEMRVRGIKLKVEKLLDEQNIDHKEQKRIVSSLEAVVESLDYDRAAEGLGVFVSLSLSRTIDFPFPVEERVVVADSFATREVRYLAQLLQPFHILVLTHNGVRLFRGHQERLEEIHDDFFPAEHEDDYEYARPSPGTSYGNVLKAFEKDKGIGRRTRLRNTFKKVDRRLSSYLDSGGSEIILAGTKELVADFEQISDHLSNIAGSVEGSFSDRNWTDLGKMCYAACTKHRREEMKRRIGILNETADQNLAAGISEVWKMANEGRGRTLFVDKDFRQLVYETDDRSDIYLTPHERSRVIADGVERVIEMVCQKDGEVLFVENGSLEDLDRIALLLRYPNGQGEIE